MQTMPVCFLVYQQFEISVTPELVVNNPLNHGPCRSAWDGALPEASHPPTSLLGKASEKFWNLPWGKTLSGRHVFRCQSSTAMQVCDTCHRGVTTGVGAQLQAVVRGAQHHNQRQCPPSPAPATLGGGHCFVHDAAGERTELGWRSAAAPRLWLRSETGHKSHPSGI